MPNVLEATSTGVSLSYYCLLCTTMYAYGVQVLVDLVPCGMHMILYAFEYSPIVAITRLYRWIRIESRIMHERMRIPFLSSACMHILILPIIYIFVSRALGRLDRSNARIYWSTSVHF